MAVKLLFSQDWMEIRERQLYMYIVPVPVLYRYCTALYMQCISLLVLSVVCAGVVSVMFIFTQSNSRVLSLLFYCSVSLSLYLYAQSSNDKKCAETGGCSNIESSVHMQVCDTCSSRCSAPLEDPLTNIAPHTLWHSIHFAFLL